MDIILSGGIQEFSGWPIYAPDALVLTLSCPTKHAKYCDVINVRQDGTVESISPISLLDQISELEVNINGGVLYLNSTVAKCLLLLSSKFPLDQCTYLGEDNGNETLQVLKECFIYELCHCKYFNRVGLFNYFQLSLIFELIGPLWIKDRNQFISGLNINGVRKDGDIFKARYVRVFKFKVSTPKLQLTFF